MVFFCVQDVRVQIHGSRVRISMYLWLLLRPIYMIYLLFNSALVFWPHWTRKHLLACVQHFQYWVVYGGRDRILRCLTMYDWTMFWVGPMGAQETAMIFSRKFDRSIGLVDKKSMLTIITKSDFRRLRYSEGLFSCEQLLSGPQESRDVAGSWRIPSRTLSGWIWKIRHSPRMAAFLHRHEGMRRRVSCQDRHASLHSDTVPAIFCVAWSRWGETRRAVQSEANSA